MKCDLEIGEKKHVMEVQEWEMLLRSARGAADS